MLTIKAETRSIFGKKLKLERQAGSASRRMPAVVYGSKEKVALSLFVPISEFKKLMAHGGESAVVTVKMAAGDKDVLIHDVAYHPVTGEPLHADFLVIDKTKVLKIAVPLRFEGIAPAVKDLAGTLVKVLHELQVEVLPLNIPREIVVDISVLATLESQILVNELKVPKEVKVLNQPEAVVAAVGVAKEEPVEEAPVDLTTIEVEKKGKKPEEAEEGAEGVKADAKPAERAGKPDAKA